MRHFRDFYAECYSGIEIHDDHPGKKLTLDGGLFWGREVTDARDTLSGSWCSGDGCDLLDAKHKGFNSFFEVKGTAVPPPTVEIRNTVFRLDETSVWGPDQLAFPCTTGSSWGATSCTYSGVEILWTKDDSPPQQLLDADALPGVTLYTASQDALGRWNAYKADWDASTH